MTHTPTTPESINDQINTSSVQSNQLDAITVYYGNIIKNSYPRPQKLSWIVQQIRNSTDLKQRVSQVRSTTDDKIRKGKKEALLPYFCFQKFKNNHRVNVEFDSTKYIIQDLDHLGSRLIDIRSKLVLDDDIFMVFLSPSGDGLKVVYEMDQMIIGGDQYRNAFGHFRKLLETKYGVAVDDNDDPSRACFLSSDPDIHINLNRKSHSVSTKNTLVITPQKRKSQLATAIIGSASPGRTDAMSTLIGHLNQRGVEESIALNFILAWNKHYNNPPLPDDKVEETVKDEYERYKHQSSIQPVRIIFQENSYIAVSGRGGRNIKTQITNFFIEPKELLMLQGSDCLTCSVTTNQGVKYDDIILENTDWHSRAKLLKAIGHQDCSFFGNDSDVQNLCSHVNSYVPIRKKGTKVIGLVDNVWVTEGVNITASGKSQNISTVPYQKGKDAFYRGIGYSDIDDQSYKSVMSDFYENITKINVVETIIPILGWHFAAPLKPVIMKLKKSFPLMFVHGSQGSGKSSTSKLFMRMHGYKIDKPHMCDIKPFPMLKLLSSSNAIPVFLDEFKGKDMRPELLDNLLRFMRKSYDGEVETKGRQDQTVESYELQAPMVVMGEWNINQPAIKERIIFPNFSNIMKKTPDMQKAFQKVVSLPLEAFMPRYVEYILNQDIPALYYVSNRYVVSQLKTKIVSPRIIHNLSVMIMGLLLFLKYGKHLGVQLPHIKFKKTIASQLKEITGTDSGMVRSAVDQLIEELGFMAQKNEKERAYLAGGYSTEIVKTPWFTTATVEKDGKKIKCLAIRFSKVFPEFKIYAKQTNYEGDLLDKESYMKMFDECDYLVEKSHVVNYSGMSYKSLCISIDKAKAAGIDLEGFGIE